MICSANISASKLFPSSLTVLTHPRETAAVMLVSPSQWQKAHRLLTIPSTAGRELLEQISLPSPRLWPRSRHPAGWVLQCLSAQQKRTRTEDKNHFFSAKEDSSACFGDFAANNFHMFNYPSQAPLLRDFPACFSTAEDGGETPLPSSPSFRNQP